MTDSTPAENEDLHLVALPGSEREAPTTVTRVAGASLDPEPIEATIVLRRRAEIPSEAPSAAMDQVHFAAAYGADPADVETVRHRLIGLGVQILSADAASRRIRISAPVPTMQRVFGTSLSPATHPGSEPAHHRVRTGGLSIPADLDGLITAVLGLDNRPQSRAMYRAVAPHAVATSYTPLQLGKIYDFPDGTDGTGQTIAIIELGGGFGQADLDAYFGALNIATPDISGVGVDGAINQAGADPNGADGEVLLDIEVVGALAPAAKILVYFAPNTDDGFLDAVSQAAHAAPTPTSMSISWGQAESGWTKQAMTAMDEAFADAVTLGVTVTAAAGDDGSADRVNDGASHVDFPAASPHVLACGGTSLKADTTSGAVTSETVWNDGTNGGATGGGYSTMFPVPSWQSGVLAAAAPKHETGVHAESHKKKPPLVSGRGVPDVAADADPQTGYQVRIDGNDTVIGGTSAVAPLWAALAARLAQGANKKLGLLQPALYGTTTAGQVATGFRDVTVGNNGAYAAAPGWDACTGLGVPVGTTLSGLF
jgi:kumamolisin